MRTRCQHEKKPHNLYKLMKCVGVQEDTRCWDVTVCQTHYIYLHTAFFFNQCQMKVKSISRYTDYFTKTTLAAAETWTQTKMGCNFGATVFVSWWRCVWSVFRAIFHTHYYTFLGSLPGYRSGKQKTTLLSRWPNLYIMNMHENTADNK